MRLKMLIALLVAGACLGCSDSGPNRQPVTGVVTLDGEPLKEGSIFFMPLGEGSTAGGEIHDGKYELAREIGPIPGQYKIEINAWKKSKTAYVDEATGKTEADLVSIIPKRYNDKTELKVEIVGDGDNQADFQLKSK